MKNSDLAPVREVDAGVQKSWWVRAWYPSSAETEYEITKIEGKVPPEIHGTLYRNGPSQKILPEQGYEALHLFDGDGLVHAFRFDEGRVFYRGRFVRNQTFLIEQEEGRFCMKAVAVVAEHPTNRVTFRQQHNTNIVYHGGKLMALVENAYPFELDPRTLEPRGENTFGGAILGISTSAHPKIDRRTGQMFLHGYQPFPPYLQYYVIEPDGRSSVAEHVETPFPGMMHDLAITENYVVFILGPVVFDAEILFSPGRPVADAFLWQPEHGLHFGVRLRRAGAETRWLRAPTPAFIFHPGNAYEDDGRIIMDACSYLDGAALLESLRTWRRGDVRPNWFGRPFFYEIDLERGCVTEQQLDERAAEFPRLDDRRVGYRNRYGYVNRNRSRKGDPGSAWSLVVKYDRTGGPVAEHDYGVGHWPSESVFVPRHSAAAEDDGFVLNVVHDGPNDASYLAILDAQNLSGAPLAKAHLERRIPMGFHGNFVSADL